MSSALSSCSAVSLPNEGGQKLESKNGEKNSCGGDERRAAPRTPAYNVDERAPRDRRKRDKSLESSDPALASHPQHCEFGGNGGRRGELC